jgi:hypothetical protein
MEEIEVKFLRAQGRKKKRRSSLLTIEIQFANDIYALNGDSLIYTITDQVYGKMGSVEVIIAGTTEIKAGDKIKIETELVPSVAKVTLIKDTEK